MSKDTFQIICGFLDTHDFCRLCSIYDLSIDIYINDMAKRNAEPIIVENSIPRNFIDKCIKKGLVNDLDVIQYSVMYDIPDYVTLSYGQIDLFNSEIFVDYNQTDESFVNVFQCPNIINHNYKHHGFRFKRTHLNHIYDSKMLDLMKIIQNYPEKSDRTIFNGVERGYGLYKLNYKHKLAYVISKSLAGIFTALCLFCGYGFSHMPNKLSMLLCGTIFSIVYPHTFIYMYNKFGDIKLPL